jgi:hypothetical protein
LVALSYVIRHTGRSPVGTTRSRCSPVYTGNTASRLRTSPCLSRTLGSSHYCCYTGRSPVSTSSRAPPVYIGGATGGSINSDQPSLDLSPRTFAVIPVETRLTSSFVFMLMISAKRVEKRCSEKPTQVSPRPRPTPVEARLEPSSKKFHHHTGRSPVDLLFSLLPLATPVEARLAPRHSGRNPVDVFSFLPRR